MMIYTTTRCRAFTLIELLVTLGIIMLLLGMILPTIQRVRGAADKVVCGNNLRQMGIALQLHHNSKQVFPPALRGQADRYPFLSWQARLLPYIDQGPLWDATQQAFAQDPRFWMEPHFPVRGQALSLYLCPAESRKRVDIEPGPRPTGFTHYLGVSGDTYGRGVLFYDSQVRMADIKDGTSHTLMVGERPPSENNRFGWWYAGIGQQFEGSLDSHMAMQQMNQTFYAPTCPPGPYGFSRGTGDLCDMFHFWSRHPGGAHFLFADGHVQFIGYSAAPLMPALASRSGNETVQLPD
jgi:prepilin-type processing-associated H-X9-DG protein